MFTFTSRLFLGGIVLCLTTGPAWSQTDRSRAEVSAGGLEVLTAGGAKRSYSPDQGYERLDPRAAARIARTAPASRPKAVATVPFVREWSNALHGTGLGATGLVAADLDGNGRNELIFGSSGSTFGGNVYWSVQEFRPATQTHEIRWQSAEYGDGVTTLAAFRHPATAGYRVFVGTGSGRIEVYDGATLARIGDHQVLDSAVRRMLLADADNNGSVDLVAIGESDSALLDPASLASRNTLAFGAFDAAIGNVDADPALELVLNEGQVISIDGAVTTVQWDYPDGFGQHVDLADIDADGRAEIIAAASWYYLRAFDAVQQAPQWEVRASHDIDALHLADVTGDGQVEVLYGDGQWGSVRALRASDGQQLWSRSNPQHGVTDVAVFNADGDAALELVWGAGFSSTGADYLYILNLATGTQEWRSEDVVGPFDAVEIGDVDGDGKPELVAASYASESDYADGIIFVYDASTHELKWRTSTTFFGGNAWTGLHDLELGDTDGDGIKEILVATDRLYDGMLYVIDGRTRKARASYEYDSGSPLYALAIADLDGDNLNEVIAGAGMEHTGSPGVYVYVINPRNGTVLWHSHSLGGSWPAAYALEVGNVDADAALEIVLSMGRVFVFDGITHDFWQSAGTEYRGLALNDWGANGGADVVAGTLGGQLVRIDGVSHAEQVLGVVCSEEVAGLASIAAGRLLFTCDDHAGLFEAGAGQSWTGETLASSLGHSDATAVSVVDGLLHVALGSARNVILLVDNSTNNIPAAQSLAASTHWRTVLEGDLLGTDADAADTLRFLVTRQPENGTVTLVDAAAGRYRYTPAGNFSGTDSFQYVVNDGRMDSAPATVTITRTNTAPGAASPSLPVHWNQPFTVTLPGSDADGDPLTWILADLPTHGSVSLDDAGTGRVTYTPAPGAGGTDAFSFRVGDGIALSPEIVANVTLTDAAPTAVPASYSIYPDAQIFGQLEGSDADDDSITFTIHRLPAKGTLTMDPNTGVFTYTPSAGASGSDSFAFISRDGFMNSAPAEVAISFKAAPATGGGTQGDGGGGGALDLVLLTALFAGARVRRRAAIPR